jgi:hypothetical protein
MPECRPPTPPTWNTAAMSASVLRPWIKAWAGAALIGVLNGVAREATYGKRLTESTAHQLSGVTGIAAFAGYFTVLQRRWPLPAARDAYVVGGVWLVFTAARPTRPPRWCDDPLRGGRRATGGTGSPLLESRRRRDPRRQGEEARAHPGEPDCRCLHRFEHVGSVGGSGPARGQLRRTPDPRRPCRRGSTRRPA